MMLRTIFFRRSQYKERLLNVIAFQNHVLAVHMHCIWPIRIDDVSNGNQRNTTNKQRRATKKRYLEYFLLT